MHIEAIKLRDQQFFADPTQFRAVLYDSVSAEDFWDQIVHGPAPVTLELPNSEESSIVTATIQLAPTLPLQCTGSALIMTTRDNLVISGSWANDTLTVDSHTLQVGDRVFVDSQYRTVTAVTATTITIDSAGFGDMVVAPIIVASSMFEVELVFPANSSSTLAVVVETRDSEI